MKKYRPASLKSIKSYSLCSRKSKVALDSFASAPERGGSLRQFLERLPDVLAVRDFRSVVEAVLSARRRGRPVILGMGAHPVKLGLAPVIIEMIEKNLITAIATNGACAIHDFEIALAGHTSEDVSAELCTGKFGMAQETGKGLNRAVREGIKRGRGMGAAIGEYIERKAFGNRDKSVFCAGQRLGIPLTVHVAIGTDITHMHPDADGAAIGRASMQDFRLFVSVISDLEGGVYINLGSAVIMPEVFLKALNLARNLGNRVAEFTTVNMDFMQHYRPRENVLRRPTMTGGRNYALTGHHEIMLPLLAAALIEGC